MNIIKGNYWIAIQDIGGFTSLSEELAKKGKEGTEELFNIITRFFKEAEEEILNYNGIIFKLAGDAYYAIFPSYIEEQKIRDLGYKLLNLKTLKKAQLKTRFVATKGYVSGKLIVISDKFSDLLISGKAIYDLDLLEENTPAGELRIVSRTNKIRESSIPDIQIKSKVLSKRAAHSPLFVAFLEVPQDFLLVHKITDFLKYQEEKIKILKWIPSKKSFRALLISGFPISTGREAEIMVDTFNTLKNAFKDYKIRMGISAGIVFTAEIRTKKFKEFAVIGDKVNIAARLCSIAPDNGIYFSEEIEKTLRGKYHIVNIGAIKLKGKVEKVNVFRPSEKISYIFEHSLFPNKFVGRKKEMKQAIILLNKRKSFCFIGDAGTGKSRMLYEIRKKIKDNNIIEIGLPPLAPPLFFIKEIFKHFPEGEVPELKKYLEGSIKLSFNKVLDLLRILLKTRNNLIIFIDDLQWLDDASFSLLKELTPLPFTIIASSRPDGEKFINGLKIQKILLKNLSKSSLIKLFESIFGLPPDKKLLSFLIEHTQGNPFYFEEILKDTNIKKNIIKKEKFFSISSDIKTIPFSIQSIILSQFNNLSEKIKKPLEIGSCMGREFSLITLKKIIKKQNIDLKEAYKQGIITLSDPICVFRHSLIQEAILETLTESKKLKYHRMIGEVFIGEKRTSYEIAYHLTEGKKIYKALPYWLNTYSNLSDQGLLNDISTIINNLLLEKDEQKRNIGMLLNGFYLTRMADYYDAEEIFLDLLKNKIFQKNALFGLAQLYDWSNQYNKMKLVLNKLKKFKMNIEEKINYLELWGIYYDMTGKNEKGLYSYKKALKLAKKFKKKYSISTNLYNIGWIYFKEKDYKLSEIYFLKSLEFTDENDLFSEGCCLLRLGQIEMLKQNFEISLNYLKKALKNFRLSGFPYWESIALGALSNLYVMLGKKQKAFLFAKKSDEIAKIANLTPIYVYMFHLYYGNLDSFIKKISGSEKEYPQLYFLYLLAKGKKQEAFTFLKENNLEHIIPNKKTLRQKTFPLSFLNLYKKYNN